MNAAQTLDLIPHKLIYLKSREDFVTFLQDQGVPTKKMQDVEQLQRYGQEPGISIYDNFWLANRQDTARKFMERPKASNAHEH